MSKSLLNAIHVRRKLLGNPYAYVEILEELSALKDDKRKLEDPYAHIEEIQEMSAHIGRFDGMALADHLTPTHLKKSDYSDNEIEDAARALQRQLWKRIKEKLGKRPNAYSVLDPEFAFKSLGYDFALVESIGQFSDASGTAEAAGYLDMVRHKVRLSAQYSPPIRNYTAAHELGHALLHETAEIFRDRPLDGSHRPRDRHEYQADRFAAFFLMPRTLVTEAFEGLFGISPFSLANEDQFGALQAGQPKVTRNMPLRELSRLLATLSRFGGQSRPPLVEVFNVSRETMAIRLEELGLVRAG